MKILHHPLVNLWLYLVFSCAVLFSPTIFHWLFYCLVFFVLLRFEGISLNIVVRSMKSFFTFLPLMLGMYLLISFIMSDSSVIEMFREIGMAIIKFILVIASMNLYGMRPGSGKVFPSIRSIWSSFNLPWRRVEDWFLFMELTFRFYPGLKIEWDRWRQLHKALGMTNPNGKVKQWKDTASQLPGIIMLQLQKADDIAQAMELRGYGQQIPRGVANPIPFTIVHGVSLIIILLSFFSVYYFA